MNHIPVRISDGVTIAVQPSLSSISTYVLLEQERWFEKESAFVLHYLKPGMTVVDIGANIGVYSLPMAAKVAPGGRVIAYEPASEPRGLLTAAKAINKADNLEIVGAALSDSERQGHLTFGASSELNTLDGSGPGEEVPITTLDSENAARAWRDVAFIKIDAEGEEQRILAGGGACFEQHSPLVLFEIKAGETINVGLRSAFIALGYECYRALAGAPILVRAGSDATLDGFELNLFAAKPDRAHRLAAEGLLVDTVPVWQPSEAARDAGRAALRAMPFVAPFARLMNFSGTHDPHYLDALAAFAQWRDRAQPAATRCGALDFAVTTLRALCQRAPTLARLSTFARAAWEWGRRGESVGAVHQLVDMASQTGAPPSEPFWPACARFDTIAAATSTEQAWFLSAAIEHFERAASFSSRFAPPSGNAEWLCAQPFASAEMERRRVLAALMAKQKVEVPKRLLTEAPDNLNAALWKQQSIIAALIA
jgi:FkbM family methyltransferase